jgi:hypothetical protein
MLHNKLTLLVGLSLLGTLTFGSSAFAQGAGGADSVTDRIGGILLQLLVILIVVEAALSALFQWRVYRIVFNSRSMKTPIMFALGLAIVLSTGYDPMELIFQAVGGVAPNQGPARDVLTAGLSALMISGGSSGIYELLKRLGVRTPDASALQVEQAKLSSDQAWLSIRALGAVEGTGVQIGIEELTSPDADPLPYYYDHAQRPPFAGTIDTRKLGARIASSFTADAQRFPRYGGRKVSAGKHYRITATYASEDGMKTVGIFRGCFASRAVVDLTVDLQQELPSRP